MKQRRAELGLTVVDAVEQSGGVARSTWRELEAAHRSRLTAPVALKVDTALDWPRGSASEIFDGHREPPPTAAGALSTTRLEAIVAGQREAIVTRLATSADQPTAIDELLDAWIRLQARDQACLLRQIRALAQS
jgi:hypothetical protein